MSNKELMRMIDEAIHLLESGDRTVALTDEERARLEEIDKAYKEVFDRTDVKRGEANGYN